MVHIHFDTKYRVDRVNELLGDTSDDDVFENSGEMRSESRSAAKYSDLLALPPAEEMVLLAWYINEAQLELAHDAEGFMYVRLGRRQGALHVHPIMIHFG